MLRMEVPRWGGGASSPCPQAAAGGRRSPFQPIHPRVGGQTDNQRLFHRRPRCSLPLHPQHWGRGHSGLPGAWDLQCRRPDPRSRSRGDCRKHGPRAGPAFAEAPPSTQLPVRVAVAGPGPGRALLFGTDLQKPRPAYYNSQKASRPGGSGAIGEGARQWRHVTLWPPRGWGLPGLERT